MPYAKDLKVEELPLRDETHIIVAQYISGQENKGERIRPSELFELLDENCVELNEILDLNYGEKLTGEVASKFFSDSVRTLKEDDLERRIAECNEAYAKAETENERREIAKKLGEYIRKKNALKKE